MSIKLTPRTVTVTLFQGDDLERIEELLEAVTSAVQQNATPRRIGDDDPVKVAAREHDDFITEATPRAAKIKLNALPRKTWRGLLADHPPRTATFTRKDDDDNDVQVEETVPEDAEAGFNVETLCDALIPLSVAPDQFTTTAERDAFLDDLDDPQYSLIYGAAVGLNKGVGATPKADLSSHLEEIFARNLPSPTVSD